MATVDDPAMQVPASPPAETRRRRTTFGMRNYSQGVENIGAFGLAFFFLGLFLTIFWDRHSWALSVLCSCSFTAIGWAVGFLFGVPRTAATDTQSNTNLEQISDWLTKVLVGVGLTQLQRVPGKLALLAHYISSGYGKQPSEVFALSMILYFSTLGFLTGYLLTRLALQEDFFQVTEKTEEKIKTTERMGSVPPEPPSGAGSPPPEPAKA